MVVVVVASTFLFFFVTLMAVVILKIFLSVFVCFVPVMQYGQMYVNSISKMKHCYFLTILHIV